MPVAESKKHVARQVDVNCAKCKSLGQAFEATIWKCPACGQANAILGPGHTTQPKTIEEQKTARKPKEKRLGFLKEAQQMLGYGT